MQRSIKSYFDKHTIKATQKMAVKFVVAALAVFVVVDQINAGFAGCLPAPPCDGLSPALLAALQGLPLGALPKLPLPLSLPLPAPAALPCPDLPPKVTQLDDQNIVVPLPAKIPVAHNCVCQKYAIAPTILPCAPAAPACPLLPPALPCAGLPANLKLLKTLLGSLPLPAPCLPKVPSCLCA